MTTVILMTIILIAIILGMLAGIFLGIEIVSKAFINKTYEAYLNNKGIEIDDNETRYIYKVVRITKDEDWEYED